MKKEFRIQNSEGMKVHQGLNRRNFFRLLGGGVLITFNPFDFIDLIAFEPAQRRQLPKDFNAFLLVGEDGTVTGFTGKIEMGQGPITSLAQELADELDVPFEKVKMIMGDTALTPYDMGTFGSLTTRVFGPPFRAAAAEARAVMLQLGSEYLKVPVSRLEIKEGVIIDTRDRTKQVTYGQLAKGKRIERFMDKKPDVKDPSQFRVMGKSYLRVDALDKVTGKAKYAGDFKMPGMLFARILRPPSHGAKLVSADTAGAEKIEGIRVVRDGDLVAVLHEMPDRADEALARIKAQYSFNERDVNDKTIFSFMLKAGDQGSLVRQAGSIDAGRSESKTLVESEFHNSYVAHSPIEPHTALAYLENGTMIVRGSTQSPFTGQESIATALEMPREQVRVITPFVGGGFGGKNANSQMVEAARLAKLTGKPVMVAWTRQEEFFHDTYRPAAVVRINSGMDAAGKIRFWDYHEYYAGTRGSDTIYDVPNTVTTASGSGYNDPEVHPFATGAWRAPGNNTNTFARESQIDIMAAKAGIDPLEFRLMNLKDEKMIEVLKAVAAKFGWKPAKGPSGRGYGIACGTDAGTWVASMAEVKVDRHTGKVRVLRVACAQNMGLCINPEGATIQMEGCITMGMGYALTEEIQFEGGKIFNRNFDSYDIPRFSWLPAIETLILDKPGEPSQGGGEPAIITMGAVIANAIFDATGARLYQLPMTPERVMQVLNSL